MRKTRRRNIDRRQRVIHAEKLSLSKWLHLIFDPPDDAIFIDYQFPTDRQREEYIQSIASRSEADIRRLLGKFLIPSGTLGVDDRVLEFIKEQSASSKALRATQYGRRLVLYDIGFGEETPWEGITWVLDLLPRHPREAIEALSAYVLAHFQVLPDGRFDGLEDASAIIRARYIGTPTTNAGKVASLLELSPRQFECVVERTYAEMGYNTSLTAPQKDGGRDILACREAPSKREHLRIECKRYRTPVPIHFARALLGVVSSEKANKGVLVTSGGFTQPTRKFAEQNPRIELIDGSSLVELMNEYLGPTWPTKIDRLGAPKPTSLGKT
jgi:restriction system protein